jgi:hypothetical protein
MLQFGGKNAKKTSSDSKRHFTVVMGDKEHGLYVSSSPSSAAKKAVTKLCISNKSKKVEFYMREITQGSKKKTYGPYSGYIEKLKEPIKLKGRVIKYKPVAKLSDKKGVKKGGMFSASARTSAITSAINPNLETKCIHDRNFESGIDTTLLRLNPDEDDWAIYEDDSPILLEPGEEVEIINRNIKKNPRGEEYLYIIKKNDRAGGLVKARYIKCSNPGIKCIHDRNFEGDIDTTLLRLFPDEDKWATYQDGSPILLEKEEEVVIISRNIRKNQKGEEYFYVCKKNNTAAGGLVKARYIKCSNSSVKTSNNWLSESQPANLSGLRQQSAYSQAPSASLSGFPGQSASLSGFPGQSAYNQGQFASLSGFQRKIPDQFSRYNQPSSARLSANIDIEKLYNSVDNLELESITGHKIPNVFIPKGQVVDVLETVEHFENDYNKIRVLTPKGYIEGFVLSKNLKKTRWLCDHNACLKYNGPYDKDQKSNISIPVTVAIILRNSQGDILVGTETDVTKMSEFNKSMPGFHLCAGKIDSGSCPVFSSYDETAEESRFLPVVKNDYRNFRDLNGWDSMFKPNGKYIIEPWVSSGRAMVFVGEIGDKFWDASNPPYGEQQTFTRPKQLDNVFEELRKKLKKTHENHKYLEKIEFKWVKPLPSGSSEANWKRWSSDNQMFGWGRSIIQDYVGRHSAKQAQIQPRQPNFSHDMSHGMAAPSYTGRQNKTENDFDRKIRKIIDSRMISGETRLSDLLELCTNLYLSMFKRDIPIEKLSEIEQDIKLNPISRKNGKNIIFRKLF